MLEVGKKGVGGREGSLFFFRFLAGMAFMRKVGLGLVCLKYMFWGGGRAHSLQCGICVEKKSIALERESLPCPLLSHRQLGKISPPP